MTWCSTEAKDGFLTSCSPCRYALRTQAPGGCCSCCVWRLQVKQHLQLEAGEEPYVLPDPPPAAAGASQAALSQWEPLRTQEASQVGAMWVPSFSVVAAGCLPLQLSLGFLSCCVLQFAPAMLVDM